MRQPFFIFEANGGIRTPDLLITKKNEEDPCCKNYKGMAMAGVKTGHVVCGHSRRAVRGGLDFVTQWKPAHRRGHPSGGVRWNGLIQRILTQLPRGVARKNKQTKKRIRVEKRLQ